MPVPSAVCIRGPVGAPGTNGETPTITSKKTDGVTTIQFKTSSTVYDVQIKDGERGPEGPKGQQGPQGDAGDTPEIIQPAAGSTPIVATDSADRPLRGLTVYGQTTQDGMPSEDAPVEMHSVGDAGEVTVSVLAGLPEGGTDRIAIIRQPRGVTAAVDSAATFRVFAIGRGLTYQWEYMPTTSTTWRNNTFPGNDTDTLTFSAKAYHDGYKYRCLITDASGNTVRTDEVTLTIGKASGSSDGAADTQTAAISITDGLRGVPVTGSAATYTDADGQGWIADTIEYDAQTGTAQLVRRVGRVTFNGNAGEEWTLDTQNNPYLAIAVQGKAPVGGLCTHYSRAEIEPGTNQTGFSAAASGDKIVFRPADFATITVDAWRARLNASPVTVLYALAVPVVTELSGDALTAMSALRSRYPATTIYNDAGAQMAARYIADTKKYVDGADAEIAKAVIGVDERVDAAMENIADAGKRADAAQTKAGENERNIGLLKGDMDYVNNSTAEPVPSGRLWSSTEDGAGWTNPGFKLIQSLVVQDVDEINRLITELSGYKYRIVYVFIKLPVGSYDRCMISFTFAGGLVYQHYPYIGTKSEDFCFYALAGYDGDAPIALGTESDKIIYSSYWLKNFKSGNKLVQNVSVSLSNNDSFPAGMEIYIYGKE